MEPSVRPYNSNSSGQPRRRASKGANASKRSDAPARTSTRKTRSAPPARKAVVETLPDLAMPVSAAEPERNIHTEEVEEQAARTEVAEPGPVITIADFEDIFARFQTPLINFVFRLVGNREQACDLTQDVFVKAYRALASGTTIQAAALSSWLYRIASNTATDALRRRRDRGQLADRLADAAIRHFHPATRGAGAQMTAKRGPVAGRPVIPAVRGEQSVGSPARHCPLTSCRYRLMNRSRARMRRIFTADGLTLSTSAISAHEKPSCSYNKRQAAYFGGSRLSTLSTISRSATRCSKRPPS